MNYRELIKANNPNSGKEYSEFGGVLTGDQVDNFIVEEGSLLEDLLNSLKKGKEELFLEENEESLNLREELEREWGKVSKDKEEHSIHEHYGYTLYIRKDINGYVFRIVNEVGALTWGILE